LLIAWGFIAAIRRLATKTTAKTDPADVPVAFKKYFNPIHTTEAIKISTANRAANVSKLLRGMRLSDPLPESTRR
jgi:hypothetical protein